MNRIARLTAGLEDPLLVTGLVNVRYLSGLESSNAALLVDPAGDATLYTDFRYAEAAREIEGVTFHQTPRSVVPALAQLLTGKRVAVEAAHLSLASAEQLRAGGVDLVSTSGIVEGLRAVKEPGELDALRRAAAISDRVYGDLARQPFVGRTEAELAWWLEQAWHDAGADGPAFDAIVAFGENGARPHAKLRDEPIPEGTLVVVDAGCAVDGYRSDCTRTFFTGEPAGRLRELYDLCLQAQLDALAAVHPGAAGRDVDAASRVAIEAAGMGESYGHGLGHGVGLDVHEEPNMRPESEAVLQAGNVVTVEPGIYLAGDVGVRIEDMVVVTDDGCERLTTVTKEPVSVA
jgi:Xaa-Pro aminopeptidase